MSGAPRVLHWFEDRSDWLSPILVKEVRQMARGREFASSFAASLVAGLAIAFFGAADALSGSGTSGRWAFVALMSCLAILGLVIVPLGAFSTLRNERLEQTLDLITVTALSPRRVVVGKLLAQVVKLGTLFAAMAPFIAMSFLLGGIDFVTILVSLVVLFMWSVWACAVCLFLSTLLKSRAMSAVVFGGVAIGSLVFVVMSGNVFFMMSRGPFFGGFSVSGGPGPQFWQALGITTTFCLTSMANLVFLAENRLSLPGENSVTTLRVGFLVQFLLIGAWTLSFIGGSARTRTNAVEALGAFGGLHLALVAMFTVTEDLVVSRRAFRRMTASAPWRWLFAMFHPGGGRGALYVLAQMGLLLAVAWPFHPPWMRLRWLLAICGYICFFTGIPALVFRALRPARAASFKLRVAVLVLLPAAMVLPDIVYYLMWRPDVLDLGFSPRHLLNPLRTLANWHRVELNDWFATPIALGLAGLVAYVALIAIGARTTVQPASMDSASSAAAAREPDSANALY